ncbi:MAG: hypothetical protein IJ658_02680 [Kiritimatiellae bacterium]|nr:hypothetical protein [Kiritimatiellia bacterium]
MTATTERTLTDRELMTAGFQVLVDALGNVNAERFMALALREPGDYTLWREKNMYVGESLHEVAERARASGKRLREQLGITA